MDQTSRYFMMEKSVISDNGTGELLIRGENLIEFANLVGEKYLRLNNEGALNYILIM